MLMTLNVIASLLVVVILYLPSFIVLIARPAIPIQYTAYRVRLK